MAIAYYGSKISANMTETPEGYLICRNVPIGRTGGMDYLSDELGLENKRGQIIKVYRNQDELFSAATIASFEGKPVTNNHPPENLDLSSVGFYEKGHVTNVRRQGELLVADLYITDSQLKADVQGGKREVSCGYDCLWIPDASGNSYEQKTIVGNHVAVVQAGRAGSRVAIKDSAEEMNRRKSSMKKKPTKAWLAALGFKHFAQDASEEEVAAAMDAFENEDDDEGDGKKKEAQDEKDTKEVMDAIGALGGTIKAVMDRVAGLEASIASGKKVQANDAKSIMDALEKEAQDGSDEPDGDEGKEKEAQDTIESAMAMSPEGGMDGLGVVPAQDAIGKFIHDMKPIIMAIPDEAARNAAAKQFAKSVRDARGVSQGANGYGAIVNAVNGVKKQAMDSQNYQRMSQADAANTAVNAWNKMNAQKGGN